MIQVFRHFGRMDGAGTGGAGAGDEETDGGAWTLASNVSAVEASRLLDGVAGGAIHLVQIVEVMVLKIVDTVFEVLIIRLVPDVTVLVTGQVVTVVRMLQMFAV
jgi:hypothetical protein